VPEILEAAPAPTWTAEKRCPDCQALIRFTQDDIRFGCRGYHFAGTFESGVPYVTCPTDDCHRRWDLDSRAVSPKPDWRTLAAASRALKAAREAAQAEAEAAAQTVPATPGGTP
jgi:hypothetical protein